MVKKVCIFILYSIFLVLSLVDAPLMAQSGLNPLKNVVPLESMQDLVYPYETHFVDLDEHLQLALIDEGAGEETIIFIHGLGSYLPAWKKNIDTLSQHYRCIAIDLPGYGKSSKLPHSGLMTFYASVIVKLLDAYDLSSVYLAGHSMGGQIAIATALYHPDRVKGLILAAPAGFETFTEGQKQWFRNVMSVNGVQNTSVNDIQNNLAYNFYNMPDEAMFMITDRIAMRSANDFEAYSYAIVQSVNGMVNEPVFNYLYKIEQPTLVIFGENDNLIPNRFLNPGYTKRIAQKGVERIPNASLQMLPRTGHFLMFENAAAFNLAVYNFIGQK
jgi:pimeloyl-ACP methyl ester carboxylesterase